MWNDLIDSAVDLISNNALISTLVGVAIVGLIAWVRKTLHDRTDSKAIYDFLLASKAEGDFTFRSTHAIASNTQLREDRVEALCAQHEAIRRNEKEKQSWELVN